MLSIISFSKFHLIIYTNEYTFCWFISYLFTALVTCGDHNTYWIQQNAAFIMLLLKNGECIAWIVLLIHRSTNTWRQIFMLNHPNIILLQLNEFWYTWSQTLPSDWPVWSSTYMFWRTLNITTEISSAASAKSLLELQDLFLISLLSHGINASVC